jgi:transcriptional regulator with XRE-family HTH domain
MSTSFLQYRKMTLLPAQCRAARALLGWSREQLAEQAEVAHRTIVDFEREARRPHEQTLSRLRAALERRGVVFIVADGSAGAGVRFAAPHR